METSTRRNRFNWPHFSKWMCFFKYQEASKRNEDKLEIVSRLPERLQNVQRLGLAVLLTVDQTNARMGNGQVLDIGMLSSALFSIRKQDIEYRIEVFFSNQNKNETYSNWEEASEIERPFFGHFYDVALQRDLVMAVDHVLRTDAVIVQHLIFQKTQSQNHVNRVVDQSMETCCILTRSSRWILRQASL